MSYLAVEYNDDDGLAALGAQVGVHADHVRPGQTLKEIFQGGPEVVNQSRAGVFDRPLTFRGSCLLVFRWGQDFEQADDDHVVYCVPPISLGATSHVLLKISDLGTDNLLCDLVYQPFRRTIRRKKSPRGLMEDC